MTNEPTSATSTDLVVPPDYAGQLRGFEESLMIRLDQCGLPSENIFVPIAERQVVFANVDRVIGRIDIEQRRRSVYFSKFMAAVASGLFDAALNYLWDETITELRKRVAQYDLSYFYDNAVKNQEKRKGLQSEADLIKIDDSELIYGAREIELISDLGFKHLDYIRFMRNWASAAHPNQNEITGLQLISFAETCIKEVLALPLSDIVIEIKRLLVSIRSSALSEQNAREIAAFFLQLTREQVSNLAQGLFGIYTRQDTSSQARQNVRLLLPLLWERVDEPIRIQFGIKYGKFAANNDQEEKKLAREFLAAVSAESYIPDDLRAVEITSAVEDLLVAHRGYNNFYTEPPLARELQRLVGENGNVPTQVSDLYVRGLVEVFLTNGNGTAWNADSIYRELLKQFTPDQALVAILSFQDDTIASRLQFSRCKEHYKELIEMMKGNVSAPAVKELIENIESYKGPMEHMKDDDWFMNRLAPFKAILT
jgi:hypothetical protein